MMARCFRHSKNRNGYTSTLEDTSQNPGSKEHTQANSMTKQSGHREEKVTLGPR